MTVAFVDADIMLDYLLKRDPFFEEALRLMNSGAIGRIKIVVSVITIANIIYFLRKKFTVKESQQKLKVLRTFVEVGESDGSVVDEMINSHFSDLEDAMQYAVALKVNSDVLITRNKQDYKQAKIPVMTAGELLDTLK